MTTTAPVDLASITDVQDLVPLIDHAEARWSAILDGATPTGDRDAALAYWTALAEIETELASIHKRGAAIAAPDSYAFHAGYAAGQHWTAEAKRSKQHAQDVVGAR